MLWRGVAIPPFHSIFISFLSFHFLPLLSTSFHAPVPVPVAVFSFSFSFPFCSCPFRFVPALSFFCVLFSRPFFFLPLLLSCPFLSLCVSSFFPCWTVVAKFGRLPEPPATGSSPSLLPTSLSAGGWCYRYTIVTWKRYPPKRLWLGGHSSVATPTLNASASSSRAACKSCLSMESRDESRRIM